MKKLLLFILSQTLLGLSVYAQSQLYYTYDAAGNLIGRTVNSSSMSTQVVSPQEGIQPKTVSGLQITTTIDPQTKILSIDMSGHANDQIIEIELYSLKGTLLQKKQFNTPPLTLDLSSCNQEEYVLRLLIDQQTYEQKISKK